MGDRADNQPIHVTVAKADATAGVSRFGTIAITEKIPQFEDSDWERRSSEFYDSQAAQIVDALALLPGATWDRVLLLMLERRASLLRVSIHRGPQS